MSTRTLRRTRQSSSSQGQDGAHTEKVNGVKVNEVNAEANSRLRTAPKASKAVCSCGQADDGSPMIHCSECKEWHHFRCLQLDARDAEDIRLYVCPRCTENTGLHTVFEWEGPEALERSNIGHDHINPVLLNNIIPEHKHLEPEASEESSDDGSEDEYVAEVAKPKGKRRAHMPSTDSETDSEHDTKPKGSQRHMRRQSTASIVQKARSASGSPGPSSHLKRRKSSTAAHPPAAKRKRSESAVTSTPGPGEDAARKYCSTKLQETFVDIFLNYPILHEHYEEDEEVTIDKKREELTDEDKQLLEGRARKFATEVEECVFETYAEPDPKTGNHVVGMKYKERFRMLTFNLSKPDRVILHKRIASSHILPKELSAMSSTDLADEETKQSIRQAEKEALAHSILKKTSLPTAKMTHKGMQDIEDVSGVLSREREREREREEEERIERERLERLKLQTQRAQAAQGSVPPESPITPITPSWGAPPPVPMHALHGHESGLSPIRPSLNPLFIHSSSDMVASPIEQELNLADLINIDEEPGQEVSISLADPIIPPISESAPASTEPVSGEHNGERPQSTPPASATGLSPFAARSSHPDFARRPSFDLNAIWSTKEDGDNEAPDTIMGEEPLQEQRAASPLVPEDIGEGGADDQDFDMFLQGGEDEAEGGPAPVPDTPEPVQVSFEASSRVWSGLISMPLDSAIPQEVSVHAQQMGGRTLGADSLLWRTLFPTDHLRIDGRVPVDKSAQYLTQMRLNPNKELIAVAFSPASDVSAVGFEALSKYLIAKNRHGLIFPWGNRPKEHHPGRELYIVPLQSTEPTPDFLALLDELKLPETRSTDYMIGVWVLNKGKLVPPPASALPTVQPPPIIPPTIPPVIPAAPAPTPSISPPSISSLTASLLPLSGSLPPNVSPAALAAEMASLTPEQIQLMLRTLASASSNPIPPPLTVPVPPVPPQPWMNSSPAAYPPPFAHASSPPHSAPPGPPYVPPPPQLSGDPYDHDRPQHSYQNGHHYDSYDRDGGDRGDRGYRGRGSGWNRDRGFDRPRDSGWRGRARGRGNQSGSSRGRQWGGSPPRW